MRGPRSASATERTLTAAPRAWGVTKLGPDGCRREQDQIETGAGARAILRGVVHHFSGTEPRRLAQGKKCVMKMVGAFRRFGVKVLVFPASFRGLGWALKRIMFSRLCFLSIPKYKARTGLLVGRHAGNLYGICKRELNTTALKWKQALAP